MKDNSLNISTNPVYVIMGVSGTGKTTIAKAVSENYGYIFLEGDDFHSRENIDIMSSGQSLSDHNRLPWLKDLSLAAASQRQKGCVFMTCSALKLKYRDEIRKYITDVIFIHLHGSFDYIAQLMSQREGHFMPVSLLQSQFDTLELLRAEELGVMISIENGIEAVLHELEAFLSHRNSA